MMEHCDHLFALLLAGGKGTRFWPLSREDHPKQLLKLFEAIGLSDPLTVASRKRLSSILFS